MAQKKILIVDDDSIIRDSLCAFLSQEGFVCDTAEGYQPALTALEDRGHELVISDVNMPEKDGFELLRAIRKRHPETVTILITGYGSIERAVDAIKMGAYDYITKPIVDDELRMVVNRAVEQQSLLQTNRNLRSQIRQQCGIDNVIGHDIHMLKLFEVVDAVADTNATVLISGASGTGKSLLARTIHGRSNRIDKPFVEVSCGAIPESLLESELFGHARGAFTGATKDKEGKFLAADGGTLFLDEINSATPGFQVKLLRVLQEKEFEPVGSNQTHRVDVRVILASNRDLMEEVRAGRFREDLYYRINVISLELPALSERPGDIPLLAEKFLERYCKEHHKLRQGFTSDALAMLEGYDWPGNVRELENVVERAVLLSQEGLIGVEALPERLCQGRSTVRGSIDGGDDDALFEGEVPSLKKALEGPERRILERALRANHWNRQATAEMLDINRTTLYKKMKYYNLEPEALTSAVGR